MDYIEDYCDHNCTWYDYVDMEGKDSGITCSHKLFQDSNEITPIQDLAKYKNMQMCCKGHAYVFHDNCEVMI